MQRSSIGPLLGLLAVGSVYMMWQHTRQLSTPMVRQSAAIEPEPQQHIAPRPPLPTPQSSSPPPPSPPLPSASPHAVVAPSKKAASGKRSAAKKEQIIVGLSKGVYRYEKERRYTCPALNGGGCLFTTERSRFGEAHALIDVLKDPRKAGPLGFRVKPGQLKGVIISEQDLAKKGSFSFKANAYDFEIGYNKKDSTIWRPFVCNEVSRKTNMTIADVLLRGPPRRRPPNDQGLLATAWPRRTGVLAAFVSNCVGWRLEYIRQLRKAVPLDSFGACAHNNDTCPKSGKHKCDKLLMASAYKFVFAFENTEESHYVTEKVYTGLRTGAIPIYKGAPEVLQHVPGPKSIIHADDFDGPAALGAHLNKLLHDQAAYEEYFKWDLKAYGASEVIAQCPWQCRLCEWIAARREK